MLGIAVSAILALCKTKGARLNHRSASRQDWPLESVTVICCPELDRMHLQFTCAAPGSLQKTTAHGGALTPQRLHQRHTCATFKMGRPPSAAHAVDILRCLPSADDRETTWRASHRQAEPPLA